MSCRRCSECAGSDHHWIEDGDSPTGVSCKHCPAIAVECMTCAGEGLLDDDTECPSCAGDGTFAVVRAAAAEECIAAKDAEIVRCVNLFEEMVDALRKARRYIINGVEFGYIRPPDPDLDDPAHMTLPAIEAVLAKLEDVKP